MNKHIIELSEDYSSMGLPCYGCEKISNNYIYILSNRSFCI